MECKDWQHRECHTLPFLGDSQTVTFIARDEEQLVLRQPPLTCVGDWRHQSTFSQRQSPTSPQVQMARRSSRSWCTNTAAFKLDLQTHCSAAMRLALRHRIRRLLPHSQHRYCQSRLKTRTWRLPSLHTRARSPAANCQSGPAVTSPWEDLDIGGL